jgi:hypothetical protein
MDQMLNAQLSLGLSYPGNHPTFAIIIQKTHKRWVVKPQILSISPTTRQIIDQFHFDISFSFLQHPYTPTTPKIMNNLSVNLTLKHRS